MAGALLFVPVTGLLLAACSGGNSRLACRISNDDTAALDEAFITREFDSSDITADNLLVTYLATESDSRCPSGVQCVRAGEATVRVEMALENAQPEEFVLATSAELDGFETTATYMGYQIELLDVIPYPESGREIREGDYCAQFVVTDADARR